METVIGGLTAINNVKGLLNPAENTLGADNGMMMVSASGTAVVID